MALLAGRFRQQLLQPRAQIVNRLRADQRNFVPIELRVSSTQNQAQAARLGFLPLSVFLQAATISAARFKNRSVSRPMAAMRHHSEIRERRIAPADAGHAMKNTPRNLWLAATPSMLEPGSVTAMKCRPAHRPQPSSSLRRNTACRCSVQASCPICSTHRTASARDRSCRADALICTGSVESSTSSSGAFACCAERQAEHLGAKAGTAHAQKHKVTEAVFGDLGRQRFELRNGRLAVVNDRQPAQPFAFVFARP